MPFNSFRKDSTCHVRKDALFAWEEKFRKFNNEHKEKCKMLSEDLPEVCSKKVFTTGSVYRGEWSVFGMTGHGRYEMSTGVTYEGNFEDGLYNGPGKLIYPNGDVLYGAWRAGELLERTLVFADGLQYSPEDWDYCQKTDRRFQIERINGIQPADVSYVTNAQPTRDIPPGLYDTGDGLYDPVHKVVYNVDDITKIARAPNHEEQIWIKKNCRTSIELPYEQRNDLYKDWFAQQETKSSDSSNVTVISVGDKSIESSMVPISSFEVTSGTSSEHSSYELTLDDTPL